MTVAVSLAMPVSGAVTLNVSSRQYCNRQHRATCLPRPIPMRIFERLKKPEYLFQPAVFWRRLRRGGPTGSDHAMVALPWGAEIRVSLADDIGRQATALGVFDLLVCEALWRLTDPADLAVDAGANVGYMTSVLAARARAGGRVVAFEPHPIISQELLHNVSLWRQACVDWAPIDVRQMGLSDRSGTFALHVPDEFERHRGESSLESSGGQVQRRCRVDVQAQTLDEVLGSDVQIGVLKLDVEGHERAVLSGSQALFAQRRVRDVVFEEHESFPTPVTEFLLDHGYNVFRLHKDMFRPRLLPASASRPRSGWEATSFLATINAPRAKQRFAGYGWRCLRARRG